MADKEVKGTKQTLDDGTSSLAIAATSGLRQAAASYDATTDATYPDAPIVRLVMTMIAATTQFADGDVLEIHEQELTVDDTSTHDAPAITSSFENPVGFFKVNSASTTQYLSADVRKPRSGKANYTIKNKNSGVVDAGWKLTGQPITFTH